MDNSNKIDFLDRDANADLAAEVQNRHQSALDFKRQKKLLEIQKAQHGIHRQLFPDSYGIN